MPLDIFDLVALPVADGRQVIHLERDDPARDIAELSAWMRERYEAHCGEHSVFLLEKVPALQAKAAPKDGLAGGFTADVIATSTSGVGARKASHSDV